MVEPVARRMWALFEPVHAVTYFAAEARAAYEQAGLRGFWRGYFASRSAPLGPVGPGPVFATFYGFARPMVDRALPAVWSLAAPADVLAARERGARAALAAMLPDAPVTEAATLARTAAQAVDLAGRTLGAANADLPWPDDPLATLWHASTILREHRGDGHVAALLAAEVDGCASLVLRAGLDLGRDVLQPARGWTDEEWTDAADRLAKRGLLDADGRITDAGRTVHDEIERITDALADGPWRALGPDRTERLADVLRPITVRVSAALPHPNPIGLPADVPADQPR